MPSEAELARLAAWLRLPGSVVGDLAPPEQALAVLGLPALGGVPRPRAKAAVALFSAVLPGLAGDAGAAAAAVAAACAEACMQSLVEEFTDPYLIGHSYLCAH